MSFNRPTLTELTHRISADISAWLPGADSRLRRSVLSVLARVVAGGFHGLYGYLNWVSRQVLPDTAEAEVLQRWATIWSITRQAATPASGLIAVNGVEDAEVPAGSVLQRADGVEYVTLADAVIAAGYAPVAVEAVEAGSAGLAVAGVILTFVSPIAGINSAAVVGVDGLTAGTEEEDDDGLRDRLLERLREPPAGGKAADYVKWAKATPGPKTVWVYPLKNGLGTVGVTFVMTDREDIIPDAGDLAAVTASIEANRPVTADVEVFAPTPDDLDFDITLTPDTTAVRAAVVEALADLLRREAAPGGTIPISRIREAVSGAAGETDNVVNSPTANVVSAAYHIPRLGDFAW